MTEIVIGIIIAVVAWGCLIAGVMIGFLQLPPKE